MKKRIISTVVAISLAVTFMFGVFPSFRESRSDPFSEADEAEGEYIIEQGADWKLYNNGKLVILTDAGMSDWMSFLKSAEVGGETVSSALDNGPDTVIATGTETEAGDINDPEGSAPDIAAAGASGMDNTGSSGENERTDEPAADTSDVLMTPDSEDGASDTSASGDVPITENTGEAENDAPTPENELAANIKKIVLGEGVSLIPEAFFADRYSGVESVFIPDSVKEIGTGAFENCISLGSVTISGEVLPRIGSDVFTGCKFIAEGTKAVKVSEAALEALYSDGAERDDWKDYISFIFTDGGSDLTIKIDETNFPDKNFRAIAASEMIDKNMDGELSVEEISLVTDLNLSGKDISDLEGIGFFTSLKTLDCSGNGLTSLNLKENIELEVLDCSGNLLTYIDLGALSRLTCLNCGNNRLVALDISRDADMEELTVECTDNCFRIEGCSGEFGLHELPEGFDAARASDWSGAEYDGEMISGIKEDGIITYKYDCGGITAEFVIEYLNRHKLEEVAIKDATCTEEGYGVEDESLSAFLRCIICEKTFADKEGTREIAVTVIPAGHDESGGYQCDSHSHKKLCKRCGESIETGEHRYDAEGICGVCGYEKPDERPSSCPHNMVKHEYSAPSCTEPGTVEYWNCTVCLKYFGDETGSAEITDILSLIIPAAGHITEKAEGRPASCHGEGNLEYYVCRSCGMCFFDEAAENEIKDISETVIPSLPHSFETLKYDSHYHWYGCSNEGCEENLEPVEHDYEITVNMPSCTQRGTIVYTCKLCGYSKTEVTSEPSDHSYGTDFEYNGSGHWHICQNEDCHETSEAESHIWTANDESSSDVGSISDNGVKSFVCSVCGAIKNETPDPPASDTAAQTPPPEITSENEEKPEEDDPVINVTWPACATVIFNPYNMELGITEKSDGELTLDKNPEPGSAVSGNIISPEMTIVNNGSSKIAINVTGYASAVIKNGNVSEDIPFVGNLPDGEGGIENNAVLLWIEAKGSGGYLNSYNDINGCQLLLGKTPASKTLMTIEKGGAVGKLQIKGEIPDSAGINWEALSAYGKIDVVIAFEAVLTE